MNSTGILENALRELEARRTQCVDELNKIEKAITALRNAMNMFGGRGNINLEITPAVEHKYGNMSVRWAILGLLAEQSLGRPMTTAQISEALIAGGNEKAGRANVSSNISDMVNKRSELQECEDGGYMITEAGKTAWLGIKVSPKFMTRASSASVM